MKNILKKIGVLGVIAAIILPFVELPKANAATECTDHTIQQYMFLDINTGSYWKHYTRSEGYATYTSYANLFPQGTNQVVNVKRVNVMNTFSNKKYSDLTANTDIVSLPAFYGAVSSVKKADYNTKTYSNNVIGRLGAYKTTGSFDYKIQTILHGYWTREIGRKAGRLELSGWFEKAGEDLDKTNLNEEDYFNAYALQNALFNNTGAKYNSYYDSDNFYVDINGAQYYSNYEEYSQAPNYSLTSFFQDVANRSNPDLLFTAGDTEYFSLRIERHISSRLLSKLNFGFKLTSEQITSINKLTNPNGTIPTNAELYCIMTQDTSVDDTYSSNYNASVDNLVNWTYERDYDDSYAELQDHLSDESHLNCRYEKTDNNIDIRTDLQYFWPVVLTVEYEVCPDDGSSTIPSDKWVLKYDGNVTDTSVANLPSNQTASISEKIEVSKGIPSRDGYKFDGWCLDKKECTTYYKAGDKIASENSKERVLYAQWAPTGTENNNKTGVISYVLGFIGVGIISGAIYFVIKRKNLFKQI